MLWAPDRAQGTVQLNYIEGVLNGSPVLAGLVESTTADSIRLNNRIVIEVRGSSFRRLRGPTTVAVIASETAYWFDENSANPEKEVVAAVTPSLLTTGGPLIQISTPHGKRGGCI